MTTHPSFSKNNLLFLLLLGMLFLYLPHFVTSIGGSPPDTAAKFVKVGCPSQNGCYEFSSANSNYINLGNKPQFNITNEITIEVWVNNTLAGGYETLVCRSNGLASNILCPYKLGLSTTQFFFDLINTSGYYINPGSGAGTSASNRISYVVATYNGTHASIYVNGTLYSTNTSLSGPLQTNMSSSAILIGASADGTLEKYVGLIDELKIYNRSLSAEQIWQNYANGPGGHNLTLSMKTRKNENWSVAVTPLNASGWNGSTVLSNNVTILNSPPENNTILTPENDSFFNYNNLFLNWTAANDNDTDTLTYFLYINGSVANGTTILNVTQILADGYYAWSILVGDGQTNSSTFSNNRTFTVDTTQARTLYLPPTEANNTFRTASSIGMNVSVYDLRLLQNITFLLANSTFANETTFFLSSNTTNVSFNFTSLSSNSQYMYNITVYDKAGNANTTETRTITLDTTTPAVSYVPGLLADGSIVNAATINVTINATETNENTVRIVLVSNTLANATVFPAGTRTVLFSGLSEGNHSFNVTVNDSAGNSQTTALRSVLLDRTTPILTLTSSAGTAFASGSSTTLTCAATDTNSDTLSLSVSGESASCSGVTACSVTYTPTTSGTKTVQCAATDKAGNSNTGSITLTVTSTGGGGDKTASAPSAASAASTIILAEIKEDTPTTIPLDTENLDQITLTLEQPTLTATVTVLPLAQKPADIPPPSGTTYSYFTLQIQGVKNEEISTSTLRFRAPLTWLQENGYEPKNVVLAVYRTNQWAYLPTNHERSDSTTAYFSSETHGFSTFAITAVYNPEALVQKPRAETGAIIQTVEITTNKNAFLIVLLIIALVALLATITYHYKTHHLQKQQRTLRQKRKRNKKRKH